MDSNNMNQFDNSGNTTQTPQENSYTEANGQYQQGSPYPEANGQYQQGGPYAGPSGQYQQGSPYQQYQQVFPQAVPQELEEPMSIREWMFTYLIMLIPCVNIIMMFVWAFSGSEKTSKSNYFKASLIWYGIIIGLYFLIAAVFAGIGIVGSIY